jgi:hypothetical protein
MKSIVTRLLLRTFENREHALSEKMNLWRGKV